MTKRRLKELLHEYKRDTYRMTHSPDSLDAITKQCVAIASEVMKDKFHYHFRKLPDANRAEIINMIHNYTTEALLPPILEKIISRQLLMERKLDRTINLLERALEAVTVAEDLVHVNGA